MKVAVKKLMDVASSEIGYKEKSKDAYKKDSTILDSKDSGSGSSNITKYWRDINVSLKRNLQGEPWCQAFAYWCVCESVDENEVNKCLYLDDWKENEPFSDFYTPDWANNFKAHKAWYSKPEIGDFIYFKNSKRIHHVGIVYDVDDEYVYTIEGNTRSGSDANGNLVVAEGGAVCKKQYKLGLKEIAGYGRPNYPKEEVVKTVTVTLPVLKEGMKEPTVKSMKQLLAMRGYAEGLKISETFGETCTKCVKNFQRAYGLKVDGSCGKETWTALITGVKKK